MKSLIYLTLSIHTPRHLLHSLRLHHVERCLSGVPWRLTVAAIPCDGFIFSKHILPPIESSMHRTARHSCADVMGSISRATFQPNDMQLYLRRNAPASNCVPDRKSSLGVNLSLSPINLSSHTAFCHYLMETLKNKNTKKDGRGETEISEDNILFHSFQVK